MRVSPKHKSTVNFPILVKLTTFLVFMTPYHSQATENSENQQNQMKVDVRRETKEMGVNRILSSFGFAGINGSQNQKKQESSASHALYHEIEEAESNINNP